MSEKVLRVLVAEIKTMRITCPHCKTAFEIAPSNIDKSTENGRCRFCRVDISNANEIYALAGRMVTAGSSGDGASIEIVLTTKD
jgi:predicted Zn finger-like uncharacterized protein